MKGLLRGALGLSLGLLAADARAEDVQWRPVAARPAVSSPSAPAGAVRASAVSVGRPSAQEGAGAAPPPAQIAILGQPVPLQADGPSAGPVTPTGCSGWTSDDARQPVVRAKQGDPSDPMPLGPPRLVVPAPGPGPVLDHGPSTFGVDSFPSGGPAGPPVGPAAGDPCCDGGPPCCPCGPTGFGADCCAPCGPTCFGADCCCTPCQASTFWASAEFLLWSIKDSHYPPLVTTSPPGTPREMAGVLGATGTGVLFGGNDFDNETFAGGRFGVGYWFNACRTIGVEGNFLFLGERTNNFIAGSMGDTILARPFVSATTGLENSELVSFPGLLFGNVVVSSASQLWGAEANVRYNVGCGCTFLGCSYRADLIGGFRFLELNERLSITESLFVPAGSPGARAMGPAAILVSDRFQTRNQFYGGQIGAEAELSRGPWFVTATGKVALGTVVNVADIGGNTVFTVPGLTTSSTGGLLTQPTNIGHYHHDRFAVLPEVGIKVGYQVNDHLRLYAGYNLLYLSKVARPENLIDRTVNVTQLPSIIGPGTLSGPARPAFNFSQTDFWAQGVTFGMEFRY